MNREKIAGPPFNFPPVSRLWLFLSETRSLITKAAPLLLQKGGIAIRGLFLTWLLMQLGTNALAAGALVLSLFSILANLIIGFCSSINITVSQALGANRQREVVHYVQQGFILSTGLALLSSLVLLLFKPILSVLGQSPAVITQASLYIQGLIPAVFPFAWCTVLHQFLISRGSTHITMMYSMVTIVLLILISYCFVFGILGLPALHIQGIGWAVAISYSITFTLMLFHLKRMSIFQTKKLLPRLKNGGLKYCLELYRIGWPISMKFCVEAGVFLIIALWLGHYNLAALATQLLIYPFCLFMNTLLDALGIVTLTTIGFYRGKQKINTIPYVMYSSIFCSIAIITFTTFLAFFFSHYFLTWFPKTHHIHLLIPAILSALPFVIAFQYLDAIRLVFTNVLFGLKETKLPLYAEWVGLWIIGIPLGMVMATHHQMTMLS